VVSLVFILLNTLSKLLEIFELELTQNRH
jgi:hypothetical protein